MLDALVQVGMNDDVAEGLESPVRGDDLGELGGIAGRPGIISVSTTARSIVHDERELLPSSLLKNPSIS